MDEVTVDPVQDDIEIVTDGEGTDAFAVSTTAIFKTVTCCRERYTGLQIWKVMITLFYLHSYVGGQGGGVGYVFLGVHRRTNYPSL